MQNFEYQWPTKIIFGQGTEVQTGHELKALGKKALLHYGGGSIKRSGLFSRIVKSLQEAGVEFIELSGVQPNPRLGLVQEGIKLCREQKIDSVLAVGGGSVIDSAKAIAAGVLYDGNVWDFYAGTAKVKETLPVGVVLTIPAAGSEASKSSVITNEAGWYKRGLNSEVIRPRFAIMNPELTYTLPPYQTAAGAADIMAHIMERYFTREPNVDLTDKLCEATLKSVIYNVPIALEAPDDYAARAEIMWASTIAHNDLLSTGRIGDWASHAIEHELSAIYDVAHGAGLAVVFPAWMKRALKQNLDKLVQFALNVWNVEPRLDAPERVALEGIKQLTAFFRRVGLPVTLEELGVPTDRLQEMVDKCTRNGTVTVGNYMKLDRAGVLEILTLAQEA